MKRLNASYANGTPAAAYSKGITDLFVSAEVVEDIRAISYNPFSSTAEQVGDGVKDEMYRSAGFGNLFGVNFQLAAFYFHTTSVGGQNGYHFIIVGSTGIEQAQRCNSSGSADGNPKLFQKTPTGLSP
jgi:hypothetical protein